MIAGERGIAKRMRDDCHGDYGVLHVCHREADSIYGNRAFVHKITVELIRDAHTRDAEGLTAEFARLTEAGRAGRLTPGELSGGTFTLNNYGVFGVDGSTPIVNHPEAAMLGVGRIVPKPWVHEGELAVRQVVQLSLTFDHRVCDGGTAGGFLRYVADCVEQPAVLLRTL